MPKKSTRNAAQFKQRSFVQQEPVKPQSTIALSVKEVQNLKFNADATKNRTNNF